MHIEHLRTHKRHSILVLPQTWWSPAVGWIKACLQQPMFCSRESTNSLLNNADVQWGASESTWDRPWAHRVISQEHTLCSLAEQEAYPSPTFCCFTRPDYFISILYHLFLSSVSLPVWEYCSCMVVFPCREIPTFQCLSAYAYSRCLSYILALLPFNFAGYEFVFVFVPVADLLPIPGSSTGNTDLV